MNRRTFTKTAAVLGTLSTLSAHARPLGSNERIRLGIIGVGNRGDQLLDAFLVHKDCEVVVISDVYQPYLEPARQKCGGKADLYGDYRKLIDRKDLDAVIVATPDHWHALQFIEACRAGKDVYCEKPLSLTIGEGQKMVQVAKETGRITQVGLHRRSTPFIMEAVKALREGVIGKITVAKGYHLRNESPIGIGNPKDSDPPAGLDWDTWLGPAPKVPFNSNRCLYKFRWFLDYSGGQLTNFGTHYLDVIQWALGQDAPKGVFCTGGKFAVEDNREIPDTLEAIFEYDGALATFSQFNANSSPGNLRGWEMEFRGTLGTMILHEGQGFEILPEQIRTEPLPALSPIDRAANTKQARAVKPGRNPLAPVKAVSDTSAHAGNFLACMRSRKTTNCPVEVGHRSTTATLLARISLARRRYLQWDGSTEKVTNDDEAMKLMNYRYREPWELK